jgi:hypothetical protein
MVGAMSSPSSRGRLPASTLWWAIVFVLATGIALALLDYAVLVLHGLTYGVTEVLDQAHVPPPDVDRYWWALALGAAVALVGTAAMLLLLLRTAARQWPAWASALLAAAVGGASGASGLLLVLGINPFDLLLS